MRSQIPALIIVLSLVCLTAAPSAADWVELTGEISSGSGAGWQSAWLDLSPQEDFAPGDQFQIKLGGNARTVLVRLLPRRASAAKKVGVVGGRREVPSDRIIRFRLEGARKQIKQISVHAGPKAWDERLGPDNGNATIEWIRLNRAQGGGS